MLARGARKNRIPTHTPARKSVVPPGGGHDHNPIIPRSLLRKSKVSEEENQANPSALGGSATFIMFNQTNKYGQPERCYTYPMSDTAPTEEASEQALARALQEMLRRPPREVQYELTLPEGFDASGLDVHEDDIRKTDYSGTILRNANFQCCDARQQEFTNCDLRGANFSGAWLMGASFNNAIIDESTIFDKAIYDEDTMWATPDNIAPPGALMINERIRSVIKSEQVNPALLFQSRLINQGRLQ